jgi:uncharacterized membrane protein
MHYTLTRALHFFGIILWFGGTIATALVASYVADAGANASVGARRFVRTIANPAMVAAWLGGLGMLAPLWSTHFSHAIWMHIKLTLVLVASGLTGAVGATLRRAEGGEVPKAKLRGMAIALLVLMMTIIGLVEFKPLNRAPAAAPPAAPAADAT